MYTRWNRSIQNFFTPPNAVYMQWKGWDFRIFRPDPIPCIQMVLESSSREKDFKITADTRASLYTSDLGTFFEKRIDFTKKSFEGRLRYYFQPSRSFWYAFAAHQIQNAGFITPTVYACGEKRNFGLINTTSVVTEALDNVKSGWQSQREAGASPSILSAAAIFLRQFHDAGFYHGDMKLTNFYFQNEKIGILDLDSVKIYLPGHLPEKLRLNDIGRLITSLFQSLDEMYPYEQIDALYYIDAFSKEYHIDQNSVTKYIKKHWIKTLNENMRLAF